MREVSYGVHVPELPELVERAFWFYRDGDVIVMGVEPRHIPLRMTLAEVQALAAGLDDLSGTNPVHGQ